MYTFMNILILIDDIAPFYNLWLTEVLKSDDKSVESHSLCLHT